MDNLKIERTQNTPQVVFNNNGELFMEGRAFCEDPRVFFNPLVSWLQNMDSSEVDLVVKLDYLNTSSTKMMNELIRTIDANNKIKTKTIKWYFEEDDEDMLEVGQFFEENTFSTEFFFYEMTEAA